MNGLFPSKKARRRARLALSALKALQDRLGRLNDLAHRPHLLAQLGIEGVSLPASTEPRRRLLRDAAKGHEALTDSKRFWR